MSIEDRFNAAVNVIRGLPKNGPYQPSNDMLLNFYSLFKQATKGKCCERRPAFWDVVSRAKWDAWNRLGEMPKEVAMENYVGELKKIVETMSYTENVANFMEYDQESGVSISDLEMVAPEAIQKVRSRPNSPLASRDTSPARVSPITPLPVTAAVQPLTNGYHHSSSNGTVVKPAPLTNGYYHYQNGTGSAQSDLSDDEYIDTVDDSESESTFRPIESASVHMSRSRMSQSSAVGGDRELYHSMNTSSDGVNAEVTAQLTRAIERLNASVQQVNNRINVVEQSVAGLRNAHQQQQVSQRLTAKNFPPWWPFQDISPRLLAFIILWPLVVSRMSTWLQRRK
ncbi:acyl-CoA-binding domain-containing protein 5 [Ochlerotatus camptorhynchus]|uniref:acyl-CoA-binding domain-containing protein 5 n=1 Tax=Ochlerotatus camptorhynchus TaxID=644619 RepID=UPI0031E2DE34